MNQLRTVDGICREFKSESPRLPAPAYTGRSSLGAALVVESMKRHTTDEGWQIMEALQYWGYELYGYGVGNNLTDVRKILSESQAGIVVMQDKREWDVKPGDFREKEARFTNVDELSRHPEIFKLTIIKDAHQRQGYHRESASEIGCHAWITYYHPKIITTLAPYVRPEHLIRMYHSIDSSIVPDFSTFPRSGCILSGAVSDAYPLRKRLFASHKLLPETTALRHPGYHMNGANNPEFLKTLSKFKVAICTSSVYGYSLRKLIEATACGCKVITDLPVDDVLPEIDGNLVRVPVDTSIGGMITLIKYLYDNYHVDTQKDFADKAKKFYDYRASGARLTNDIEIIRTSYKKAF